MHGMIKMKEITITKSTNEVAMLMENKTQRAKDSTVHKVRRMLSEIMLTFC